MAEITDEIRSPLKFLGYSISSLLFKRNESFQPHPVEIKFDVNSTVKFVNSNTTNVTINLLLFPNAEASNYPFTMELSFVGEFKIENFDPEKDNSLFEINAVTIMFPYLRALVTTITANANVPPLILPPINVINLIRNKK